MDELALAVEPSIRYRHQTPVQGDKRAFGIAMSNAACDLAETLGAKAILVPTFSGRTASAVARLRPHWPIIGLSHNQASVQQMALEWGVIPILFPEARNVEDLWDSAVEAARRSGLIEAGDLVVLTAGTAVNMPGTTNMIKVEIA
jgi:pyruvate kinase